MPKGHPQQYAVIIARVPLAAKRKLQRLAKENRRLPAAELAAILNAIETEKRDGR